MKKSEKRERRSREQWRCLVEAWRGSGTPAKEFARSQGLSTTSLYYWSSVLTRGSAASVPKLLPVRVATSVVRSSSLELAVGPLRLRFEDSASPRYVASLARALLEASSG
jgi:hypothetical protein